MAASSSTKVTPPEIWGVLDSSNYELQHHYIKSLYTDIAMVGCTNSHAFVVTIHEGSTSIHRAELPTSEEAKTEGIWSFYFLETLNYLCSCAYKDVIAIVTRHSIVLVNERWQVKKISFESDVFSVQACTMGLHFLYVAYTCSEKTHSILDVYSLENGTLLVRVNTQDKDILYLECVGNNDTQLIVGTASNSTEYHVLTYDNGIDEFSLRHCRKWVLFPETFTSTQLVRDFKQHRLIASASGQTLSLIYPESVENTPRLSIIPLSCDTIVDVLKLDNGMYIVHDAENNLIAVKCETRINANNKEERRFYEHFSISRNTLLRPNIETDVRVPRISHSYKSLSFTRNAKEELLVSVLLPSGDLLTVKIKI